MVYAIVIYPEIKDDSKIQSIRKKHDPYFGMIEPHITLVFPFPDIDRNEIKNHVLEVIKNFEEFDLRLNGLTKSFDNWLFLTVKEGNDKVVSLHDRLYTGVLEKYLRKDIEFIPHVGLGLFENDKDYKKAEGEAKRLSLNYKCRVRSIYLIHLKDDLSEIDWSEEFSLI